MSMSYSGDTIQDTDGGVLRPISSVMRNRIINGGMVIDQRNAGAVVTTANVYSLDRWASGATQASKFNVQQNAGAVTPPVGFTNYLGITSTSAYSVLAGDTFLMAQIIEGFNIADLGFGTANAQAVTLSFWVRSSLTGTFGGSLMNGDSNRSYLFSYSIPAANTWTKISVTVTGDTSGTWLTTNGKGINVRFGLGSGSTYSGTAGSWLTGNIVQPTSTVSVVGTNGATFYITGVQLEVGSSATGFEYRQYGQELALCQRYYETNSSPSANGGYYTSTSAFSTTQCRFGMIYQVPKRAQPSITFAAGSTFNLQAVGANTQPSSFTTVAINPNNFYAYATGTYTLNVPYMLIDAVSTSFINISAEL